MRRRDLLLGISAAAAASTARAQQAQRSRRLGVLSGQSEDDPATQRGIGELRRGLEARGWREGDNLRIEYRFAAGDPQRVRALASELVGLAPDLIVAHTTPVAAALAQVTRSLPIVFVSIADPVADGFVASLARPGGYMTGFTNYDFAMGAKWLQILKEIAPRTVRVALLLNPDTESYYAGYLRAVETGAATHSVVTSLSPARNSDQIEEAIAALGHEPGAGLIVLPSAPITAHIQQIIELTARYRVPAIYPFGSFAKQGGLAAYGTRLDDLFARAASYVDRILRGEKAADLPVQGPTKFELVINLRTAKALGLTVPPLLLAQADEVIE